MELNIFMRELESALVRRGIPDETAKRHVNNLSSTFTSDDLSEINSIQTNDEIEELADSISVILNKNRRSAEARTNLQQPINMQDYQNIPSAQSAAESTGRKDPVAVVQPPRPSHPQRPYTDPQFAQQNRSSQRIQPEDRYYDDIVKPEPTIKGMTLFWVGLFVTLPITLAILGVIFGSFIAVFAALAALIVAGVLLLIALVAVGAGVSLVGVVFGVTQLFSFIAAGVYEIGLGIMIAGAVMFVAILIYNLSIRFFPWVITQVGNFLGFVCGKLKELFKFAKRECYKL